MENADINGDGSVDAANINRFVSLFTGARRRLPGGGGRFFRMNRKKEFDERFLACYIRPWWVGHVCTAPDE
jgi:hypothetical protein